MWARGIVLGSDSMNALDKASRRDYASRVRHRASINTPFVALLQLDRWSFGMRDWAGPQLLRLSCDSGSRVSARTET